MFKVVKKTDGQTYPWPIAVDVPLDGGGITIKKFTVYFRRHSQSQLDDLINRKLTDEVLVREVMTGWGPEVVDEDNAPLDFTPDNLTALLEEYPTRPTIAVAFWDSIKGSKRKN